MRQPCRINGVCQLSRLSRKLSYEQLLHLGRAGSEAERLRWKGTSGSALHAASMDWRNRKIWPASGRPGAAQVRRAKGCHTESARGIRAASRAVPSGSHLRCNQWRFRLSRRNLPCRQNGTKIASEKLTVIDDATIPRLFGSSPFDDEGVPSRRTTVIQDGVLQSWLLNSYTGRKLGLKTTGNASRGITGNAGVGHGNFYIPNGATNLTEILKSVKNGLYVTELIGFGVNIVTGDYSRGAAGLWIENGELAYPVSEITIASTIPEMLMNLETIGSDLEFRNALASPTLLIGEMTISGQ